MLTKSEATESLRVAFYIRVSTEAQGERGDGYGIDLQQEALRSLVKSRGKLSNGKDVLVIAKKESGEEYIYIDDGVSGTTPPDDRAKFSQLKEDLL